MNAPALGTVTILSAGFVLGLKHAFDADHVAVVTAMVSQSKNLRRSSLLGAMWGIGHTTTLLLVGVVVLVLKITIPARLALEIEFIVGLVVIGFGLDLLRKVRRGTIHAHLHVHDGTTHSHAHSHAHQPAHHHRHRALAVGMLHGLAGSAALTLLVLASVGSVMQGVAFILIFGLGSIVSMVLISAAIGLPFLLTQRFARMDVALQTTAGVISVAVGLSIITALSHHVGFIS